MDFSKIMSIAGRPGLYQMLAQTKNGLIVESITDGKRLTAFSHERISSLKEISIYTSGEDMPLKDVMKAIYEKLEGKPALSHKSESAALKEFFAEAIPEYDREQVYVSDIKKVVQWYNLLLEKDLLVFDEEEDQDEKAGDEEKNAADQEKPAKESKKEKVEEKGPEKQDPEKD